MGTPYYTNINGIIYKDYSSIDMGLQKDNDYNAEHYLVFDSEEFINSLEFSEYVKNIIKKFYIDRDCPSFKIQSHITENSFDIFRFEFGNILLTLKIPPKSDILNISRERLFYSISINNRPFDVEQCMTNFEQLRSTLRGII